MVFGYCRISTAKQSIERQQRNIIAAYPTAKLMCEAYSGRSISRPVFDKMLKQLKTGDVVVFDSISRMSRDAAEGITLYKRLFAQGIELHFLKEPFCDTTVYREELQKQLDIKVESGDDAVDALVGGVIELLNDFLLSLAARQIELAFAQAEKEVDDLRQRTAEGIETARRNGKQIGQQAGRKLHTKKSDAAKLIISKHSKDFDGTLGDADVIKLAGCSRNSYYRYKGELRQEREAALMSETLMRQTLRQF